MKKIAMFTMGTRGDVQPYIYLAQELVQHGCEVLLGSHPCWKNLIESSGVKFIPIGPDIDIEKEAAIIRGKNKNPALSMLKTMRFVFKIVEQSSREVYQASIGKDLIIVSHSQMGATEAEVLNIPIVNVTLQTEMIPQARKPKTFMDRVFGGFIAKQIAKPYNKIRKQYGLKPAKDIGKIMSKQLDLIPISTYVKQRNPYWEPQHILTGFWYQEAKGYEPDEKLREFLKSGEKPILLALGAMSFEDKAETAKLDAFVKAFEKCGERAMIQGFQKTLKEYKLPDTMIAVGSIPHSYLFQKCKMVVHHCGFGTAAATLIYGVPSIPVPHVLDQIGFANILFNLGVACKPLDGKHIREQDVICSIHDMENHYQERLQTAQELSEKIREEHGLQSAVKLILETMNHEK
ncbi:glycosyltransferase [Massilioclostridium coli]|uniref:glycosyltransferase n=1 Tax=Massilioclostridium coli TaxID=1870991 RepID=UPI00085BB351|nr:glycosyltransferase [Massilioclostridium coli]